MNMDRILKITLHLKVVTKALILLQSTLLFDWL